ncbi:transposase [Streptomyces sp. NPDC050263]|uniref:transposase n=1 Tax=Streptomyces sp. NPDC050263 TaxID=3155037 RepID=UPI003439719D
MLPLAEAAAWVIDDVSVPKDGRMSAGVAPQHCEALGERADCQVVVSVHAAGDTASCPLQWRPALDMLDTLAGWGISPPVVVADVAYGTNAHLRPTWPSGESTARRPSGRT